MAKGPVIHPSHTGDHTVADPRTPAEGALSVLTAGAAAVARGADLDTSLGELLGAAVTALGADVAAVWLQDPDRAGLELVGTIGLLAARGSEPVVEVEAAPAPTPLPQAR